MFRRCKFKPLIFIFLLGFLIGCVHDEPFTEGLAFTKIEGQEEYAVTGYTGTASSVVIPETYQDLPVTRIGEDAFASCAQVTSISLPNSITIIDETGLVGTSLSELWIPDGMQYFGHVLGLTDVDVRVRETHLFHRETMAGSVRSIVSIDGTELIFVNRTSEEIALYEVPESITIIGNYAMSHTNFGEIVLPDTVALVKDHAFDNSLAKVNIPSNITRIGDSAYVRCQLDENLVLPEGLTAIGSRAFGENDLVSIVFPSTLTELGSGVFYSNSESGVYNHVTTIEFKAWQLDGQSVLAFETGFLWLNYKDTAIKEITVNLPEDPEQAGLLKESLLVSSQQSDFLTDVGEDFVMIKVDYFTEGLVFTKIKDKEEYEVTEYTGTAGSVVVPETYQGLPVTKIGDNAFYNCSQVTSIRLPNTITAIERNSLNRTSITELWIPDGMYYFGDMWDLYDIDIRVRDTHLYHREMMIGSIRTIVSKDGTELIYVNRSSEEIPVFEVPTGITKIGSHALYRSHFGEIILPNTVTVVGEGAFEYSLAKVNIPSSIVEIQKHAYVRCQLDENLVLHEGLTTIGHGAFGENNLVSIVFPATLTELGCGVFYSYNNGVCNNVTTIEFKGWQLSEQSVFVFEASFLWMDYNDIMIKEITVILPEDPSQALLLKESLLASWDDPNFLMHIGSDFVINFVESFTEGLVFSHIKDKEEYEVTEYTGTASSVVVPETYLGLPVTKIGDYAFYECSQVTSIRLPNSIAYIGRFNFIRTSLTELWIPDGMYYFGDMEDLDNIDVRVRDTHLYHQEIMVGSIRTIVSKDGTELIYVNRSSEKIPVFEVPAGITKIGNHALYESNFGEIILPYTVTVVGEGAFEYSLAKVNIPSSIVEIQKHAYVRCQLDENLVLHEGLTTIGGGAFGENNLVSIVFPASLTELGGGVFYSSIIVQGAYNHVTTIEFKSWKLSEQSVSVFEFSFLWMNYKDTGLKEITVILPDDQAQALLLKESLLASSESPNFLMYVGSDFVINYQEGTGE